MKSRPACTDIVTEADHGKGFKAFAERTLLVDDFNVAVSLICGAGRMKTFASRKGTDLHRSF